MLSSTQLLTAIKSIYAASRGRYGSPRIHAFLRRQGIFVSRKRVARIMQLAPIQAYSGFYFKSKRPTSTLSQPLPDLLSRSFQATAPNQIWTTDLTYCRVQGSWVYLAVVMDLFSRKIVGWQVGKKMDSSLVIGALWKAYQARKPAKGLIHHSDRGSQYRSKAYQRLLANLGMRASMSRKGNCYDNAVMETFFASLKKELIRKIPFENIADANTKIFEYIAMFYNRERLHSTLGYRTPHEFEQSYQQQKVA